MNMDKRLKETDYEEAANMIGCDIAAIKAIAAVESTGYGFLPSGKPVILFESYQFSRLTKGIYNNSHPNISTSKWIRNYYGGEREYQRLELASSLNLRAALKATSWGMFQIMGFNHNLVGYEDLLTFVEDMHKSERLQLLAFVNFIKTNKLSDEIVNKDWAGFAYSYNGPGYKKNNYDTKLATAYDKYANLQKNYKRTLFLRRPMMSGEDVMELQKKLGIESDGYFGPTTQIAVIEFQKNNNLIADGIAGPNTLRELGLWE